MARIGCISFLTKYVDIHTNSRVDEAVDSRFHDSVMTTTSKGVLKWTRKSACMHSDSSPMFNIEREAANSR